MSERDQQLVRCLGISVAQIADTLERSRQAVNRGIALDRDYFKAPDLAKALEVWRRSDSSLYGVAKSKICQMYPEVADAILDALGMGRSVGFSADIPGEYWFICSDFVGFRNTLPACADQIEALCRYPEAQVKLFVDERDATPARRFAARTRNSNNTAVIVCQNTELRLAPSTLLRMDHDDNIDLFGVSDTGFVTLSRQEANRLRLIVADKFFHSAEAN